MVQTELAREISYGRTPLNYGLSLEDFSLDFSTILSLEGIWNEEDLWLSLEAFDPKMNGSFIRDVFESECKNLKIDMRLAKTIQRYAMAFVTKNEEHIQFFGSILIGVHKVRFTDDDRLAWFDDVLDVDEISLTNQLHSAPTINPDFMVSSDAMNHSFIWLLHKFHTSDKLSNSVIHDTKVALISIMHYKFITSLIAWYFKYPADREIALAAYSSLSKKFDIKQYGSWSALIRARAESIVAKSGIHFNTYVRYNDDRSIIYMVNDIQSRIRELIKALTREFMEIHEKNARIGTSTSTMELEGEKVIRDRVKAFTVYRRYMQSVVGDLNSFIKPQLVKIVSNAMSGAPTNAITEALTYMSKHYNDNSTPFVADLVDEVLLHAFEYLQRRGIVVNDLTQILTKLRAIYTASRSSDPAVLKMRELGDTLVERSVSSKNDSVKAGVRTSVLLYVLLRALTRNYYTSK